MFWSGITSRKFSEGVTSYCLWLKLLEICKERCILKNCSYFKHFNVLTLYSQILSEPSFNLHLVATTDPKLLKTQNTISCRRFTSTSHRFSSSARRNSRWPQQGFLQRYNFSAMSRTSCWIFSPRINNQIDSDSLRTTLSVQLKTQNHSLLNNPDAHQNNQVYAEQIKKEDMNVFTELKFVTPPSLEASRKYDSSTLFGFLVTLKTWSRQNLQNALLDLALPNTQLL